MDGFEMQKGCEWGCSAGDLAYSTVMMSSFPVGLSRYRYDAIMETAPVWR